MGAAMGILGKFGVSGVQAMSTDKIFDEFFKDVKNFQDFHMAFLNCLNYINNAMLGVHYTVPSYEKLKEEYESKWKNAGDDKETQKSLIKELLKHQVKRSESADNTAVIMAGIVAPPAAVVVKRAGQSVPQINKLRLHLIPDWLFVPVCTTVAIIGAKGLQIRSKSTT